MNTQPNWKKPLALASGLLVLSTFAYWLEYSHKPKQDTKDEESRKVFKIKKDDSVVSVRLSDGSSRIFALTCLDVAAKMCKPGDNSKWELTEPLKLKADDSNANSLVSTLNTLNTTESFDLKQETAEKKAALLNEYGLPSERSVTLKTTSGELTLFLGSTNPIGEGIFSQLSTDPDRILIVPSYFKPNLEHDLTYWRDKKVLTLAANDVDSFTLESSKGTISGDRANGTWSIQATKGPEANQPLAGDLENVDNLLASATSLAALSFASNSKSDAKAKAALSGAKHVVTLTLRQKSSKAEPVTLKLFAKAEKNNKLGRLLATSSAADPLFELEPTARERFEKSVKDLRLAKLMTSLERFTAKKLTFAGKPLGADPVTLTQGDGKWQLADKTEADSNKVQTLLERLSGNRIQEFLTGSAIPGGEDGGIVLTIADEKSEAKRKIAFWKVGALLYGRDLLSQRKEAFKIDSPLADALPWEAGFFKKAAGK